MDTITLEHREIIDLPDVEYPPFLGIRHFGVALDNDEAQKFIEKNYRVFCDDGGPFLVIRLRATQRFPIVVRKHDAEIEFSPVPWEIAGRSGIICWLNRAI